MSEFGSGRLTPEGKESLRRTVRGLREEVLVELHDAAERQYRLSVKAPQAGLAEPERERRRRLEDWLDEQVRTVPIKEQSAARERFRRQAEKEAAYTLVHRIVLLRHMEALGLSHPPFVTSGWNSPGYREFRDFAPGLCQDETEGYAALLQVTYDELALDLPGLFGDVGLTEIFPVPAPTLRKVVEAFDAPDLASAWTDDTTLGWVYQFWNDPEREALDAKLNEGGKIEPHEIASKTQMFTERYMVEWLLHNSIGQTWLCMCKKHRWTPDAEQVLDQLDRRRAEWREKRERGEVALDALMPIQSDLEDRWKYWVPQPLVDDAVEKAPESVHDLTVLDPACGSGHFLVIAFNLLAALYREEARHRGLEWSDQQIAEWILEKNLHGVDIDPRCIQLAAALIWLKAKVMARDARPKQLNLVAPAFRLANLPDDDPALIRLIAELEKDAGIPEPLSRAIVTGLKGVDHLGSLLKVEATIDEEIAAYEKRRRAQKDLFHGGAEVEVGLDATGKALLLDRLEKFLSAHSTQRDLGLRLEGEQLAAGIRFLRTIREHKYAVVVGNPPYQGTSKMADAKYVACHYSRGKPDLYAAFLQRGLEMGRDGASVAMVTMQSWMFTKQYSALRSWILSTCDLRLLADLMWCAFENMRHNTIAMAIIRRARPAPEDATAIAPTPRHEREESIPALNRKRAGTLSQEGRFQFRSSSYASIDGSPIVYWWSKDFFAKFLGSTPLAKHCISRKGIVTGDDVRFTRRPHEIRAKDIGEARKWAPFVMGGKGVRWFEPLANVFLWSGRGLETAVYGEVSVSVRMRDPSLYFRRGIAFSPVGNRFAARLHRHLSIAGNMGSSIIPDDVAGALCSMNSSVSQEILASLNPGLHFELGDVERLPLFPIEDASEILRVLEDAFANHEARREPSVEFRAPGRSAWSYAQRWAQCAVDRPAGLPIPPYEPEFAVEAQTNHISFAVGVALGRFGANGEGIRDEPPDHALPDGLLFLSATSDHDSLSHQSSRVILDAWESGAATVDPEPSLKNYLQNQFFSEVHRPMYDNRPIYFPLSSPKRNFVAYVSIHRWTSRTLSKLLANHLIPEQRRLYGQIDDLRTARTAADRKQAGEAERTYTRIQALLEELNEYIEKVKEIAERGAPPTDAKCEPREVDAPFEMDLDDGVMINSAALWPLLEPQWKEPKKWWKELCTAKGRKDYDWAHLARRYFPTRVDGKCKEDPSLAVAHGCFWKYHPAKAYAWELRLKDEIGPEFTINEEGSDELRAAFIAEYPEEAAEIRAKEQQRLQRKARKAAGGEDEDVEDEAADVEVSDDGEEDEDAAAAEADGPLFAKARAGKRRARRGKKRA